MPEQSSECRDHAMEEMLSACTADAEHAVQQALAAGLDKNAKGKGGDTALHVCG